jgi:hypothetical protein
MFGLQSANGIARSTVLILSDDFCVFLNNL